MRPCCPSNGILAWPSMLVHGVEKHRQAHTHMEATQAHTKLQRTTTTQRRTHHTTRQQQSTTWCTQERSSPPQHHNKERSSPPQHHTRKARPPQHHAQRARPPQTKSKCNVVVTTTKNRGQLLLAGEAPAQTKHISNVGVSKTSVHVEAIRSNLHSPPTCQGAHRTRLSERRQRKACKTRQQCEFSKSQKCFCKSTQSEWVSVNECNLTETLRRWVF